jgi:hypothetical protein
VGLPDPHFRGACQIIVDNANLTLLSMPRIQQLMQTKWDKFAARPFLQRFIVTLICICIFLFSVVLKSEKKCGDPADGTGLLIPHCFMLIVSIVSLDLFYDQLTPTVRRCRRIRSRQSLCSTRSACRTCTSVIDSNGS